MDSTQDRQLLDSIQLLDFMQLLDSTQDRIGQLLESTQDRTSWTVHRTGLADGPYTGQVRLAVGLYRTG